MSQRENIENLLAGNPSEIAPTVTELKQQDRDEPAAEPMSEPSKQAQKATPERKTKDPVLSSPKPTTPIRFQISAPEGGEVERALADILASIPKALRAGISIGALFRQVMIENDEDIAKMIRKSITKG